MVPPIVKRTYASNRTLRSYYPSSPRSSYSSDPVEPHDAFIALSRSVESESESESASAGPLGKRKRSTTAGSVAPAEGRENVGINLLKFLVPKRSSGTTYPPPPPKKRVAVVVRSRTRLSTTPSNPPPTATGATNKSKRARLSGSNKQLTQLHLTFGKTSLRTCPLCELSYTHGAPDDEDLHKKHCARITRGAEWGKEEARCEGREVTVVEEGVIVRGRNGKEERARIVKFNANVGGKLGAKLATVMQTVNLALSAPDLPAEILADSKAYLLLLASSALSSANATREREKIVGCVIAQRIETAMKIIPPPSQSVPSDIIAFSPSNLSNRAPEDFTLCDTYNSFSSSSSAPTPITVQFSDDSGDTGLFCSPTPLPTPLGIPRLFVSSSHRHKGIASLLLAAAAKTFIHGCPLRPELGQVAFSQPTRAGRGVMERWGKGGVRIYQE